MAFMVGDANVNHGIYDWKKSGGADWVLMAGSDNKWYFKGTADEAASVAWDNVTSKPIEFITYSGSLASNGWKTMGARTSGAKIAIAYNNGAANWNSAKYSSSLVFGCNDTKGLIDCSHANATVTFGGSSNANGTDGNPNWYYKLTGTSGKTYTFPEDTCTLVATTGSITGTAANVTGTVAIDHGGTGTNTAPTQWGIIYASSTTAYASTGAGTAGYLLQSNATSAPSWIQATNANTGSTIVKRDASGNFSAGTITATLSGTASSVSRATFGDASNGEHNCNNITSNGLWYYTSNGPSGLGNYTADAALYSQAHNSNWVGQIAQDYRNGGLFVRSKKNGSWQSWRAIPNGIPYVMTDKNIVYDATTNKFTKVAGSTAGWDSEARSLIGYKECRITFQAGQADKYIMAGLNTDPAANVSWTSIDYCWFLNSDGSLQIRESNSNTISPGTGHTTYATGDEFVIEYSNGYIRYYHNGVLCRIVSRSIGSLLYFDSSFHNYGNIYNVQFAPIQSNVSYGTTLPTSAVEGQTFFQVSDPWYELPPGGTSGQVLTKASNSDRDVSWASPSQAGVSEIANMIYPVGSIYMSVNSIDPSALFGGTWERLKDRFLLSAGDSYSAGNTGGEATHKLVEGELPSHTHTLSSHTHTLSSHTHSLGNHTHGFHQKYYLGKGTMGYNGQALTGNGNERDLGNWNGIPPTTTDGPSTNTSGGPSTNTSGGPSTNTSGSTGSNTAHNNMPPYLVVYMWKRTA